MKLFAIAGLAAVSLVALPGAAMAASCYDLWYARNEIYAENGFCFSSSLAISTFGNDDCYTKHPHFSKREQREIDAIAAEEADRGCRVN